MGKTIDFGPSSIVLDGIVNSGAKMSRQALALEKKAQGYLSLIGNGNNFDDMKRVDSAHICLVSAAQLHEGKGDNENAKRCIGEARELNSRLLGMLRKEISERQNIG